MKNLLNNFNQQGLASVLFLILLVVGIGVGTYLVGQQTNLLPKAADDEVLSDDINSLTNQLLAENNSVTSLESKKSTDESKLEKIAIKRKELLLKQIEDNPQKFLDQASLVDERDNFSSEVKKHLEERVTKEGELVIVHGDDFDQKKSKQKFYLREGEKTDDITRTSFEVYFSLVPPQRLESGAIVDLKGVKLENKIVTQTGPESNQSLKATVAKVKAPTSTGSQKVAVVLVNFENDKKEPVTKEMVKLQTFGSTQSVSNYYRQISFNKVAMIGDVFGWVTISQSSTNCDYWNWSREALTKLDPKTLKGYNRFIYIFPENLTCGYLGFGTIGGSPSEAWVWARGNEVTTQVLIHEFGHNLGVHHANALICSPSYNNLSDCSSSEYDDIYDIMGNFWYVVPNWLHFNAPHKVSTRWLLPSDLQTVTISGTYQLFAEEIVNKGKEVIKILKPDTDEYYYLSYRQPVGLDAGLPVGMTDGTSIHLWNDLGYIQTKFIDVTPGDSEGFSNGVISDNEVFYDKANDITIKQLSHNNLQATVEVKYGPNAYTGPATPTLYYGTSFCENNNPVIYLSWSVSKRAVKYQILRNGQAVGTEVQPFGSDIQYYYDRTGLSGGQNYTYQITAQDSGGKVSPASNSVEVTTYSCI